MYPAIECSADFVNDLVFVRAVTPIGQAHRGADPQQQIGGSFCPGARTDDLQHRSNAIIIIGKLRDMLIKCIDNFMWIKQPQLGQTLNHGVEACTFRKTDFPISRGDQSASGRDRFEKRPLLMSVELQTKTFKHLTNLHTPLIHGIFARCHR